jgi:putative flippase GtrA
MQMKGPGPDRYRFFRFLAAGAMNTLFGFAVFSMVILLAAPVWAALLIASVVGVVFNFFTTGGYAFRSRLWANFPGFCAAYVVLYLLNWVLIGWLEAWVPGKIVAQAILTLPMAIISYVIMARLVFATAGDKRH